MIQKKILKHYNNERIGIFGADFIVLISIIHIFALHNIKKYHERKSYVFLHIITNIHSFLLHTSGGYQFAFPSLSS